MKNSIYNIRGFFSDILIYSTMLFLGLIGLPFSILSKNWAYKFIKIYCSSCFFILRIVAKIHVECRGDIPKGNVLICAKHMSFLDILILAYYLPRFSFVMKKELIFTPVIGVYALRVGCVPVARGKGSRALNKMVKSYQSTKDQENNQQIIIYPQGTRVLPGETKKYKIGAGALYNTFRLPCHLVGTNSGFFWPKGSFRRKPGIAIIDFHSVLKPGLPTDEFMLEIEKGIEQSSNALIEETEARIAEKKL